MDVIEDIQFENLLKEKQHKQLLTILGKILKEIGDNKTVTIDKVTSEIDLEGLKNMLTFTDIPIAIKSLGDILVEKLGELKRPNDWHFKINRDNSGYIVSVDAKQKESK